MDPFLGQIVMFAGTFAPRGWAFCEGQLLSIASNTALFSILGTTYGGDGRTTFALPDLRGRVPMHPGNGPGLGSKRLGERGGTQDTTLMTQNLPPHNHAIVASGNDADSKSPTNAFFPTVPRAGANEPYASAVGTPTTMNPSAVGNTGSGLSFSNLPPYNCLNYIIALQGVFPSRS